MAADFRASEVFKSIKYVEVKNSHLSSPYVEADFKKDGQWLWKLVANGKVPVPRVRPAWSVFVGQKLVSTYFGTNAWKETALPHIAKLVKASIESPEKQAEAIQTLAPIAIAGRTSVEEVDFVPYLDGKGKDAYRVWLKRSPPRAFAVGIDGAWGRGKSVSDALAYCERYSSEKCEIYAVDQEVVWYSSIK